MDFTERDIEYNKLLFIEEKDFVIIGKNRLDKQTYLANKKVFNQIINLGDVAWNETIPQNEITKFLVKLSTNKVNRENHSDSLTKECKGENMDMKELAKQETIKNGFDNIPVGMTKLKADSIDISPTEVEFNGIKKTRYELAAKTIEGKDVKFGCGIQIYNGLIEASKVPNVKIVYITRNGTTKDDTKYTVVGE